MIKVSLIEKKKKGNERRRFTLKIFTNNKKLDRKKYKQNIVSEKTFFLCLIV
jgi:hypothetical protein